VLETLARQNKGRLEILTEKEKRKMDDRVEEEKIRKLKEIIQEKEPSETVEEVLVKFCARNAVSLNTCKRYYKLLVASGEIKET
jgi:hypothetical protein